MIEDRPLLRGNWITFPELNQYYELLSVESDALHDLLVGHIKIRVNDLTTEPYLNVSLDGEPYLRDFLILESSITLDWGKQLRLHGKHKKPIVVQIKQTKAGTLKASAFVDGLEVPAQR